MKRGPTHAKVTHSRNKGLTVISMMTKKMRAKTAGGMGSAQTLSSLLLCRVFNGLHAVCARAKVQTKGTVLQLCDNAGLA
jgi:hypothetical protein